MAPKPCYYPSAYWPQTWGFWKWRRAWNTLLSLKKAVLSFSSEDRLKWTSVIVLPSFHAFWLSSRDHSFATPRSFPSYNLIALQWKWNPYCCRISQSNTLIFLDHILELTVGTVEAPIYGRERGGLADGQWHVFKWLICFLSTILSVSSLEGIN